MDESTRVLWAETTANGVSPGGDEPCRVTTRALSSGGECQHEALFLSKPGKAESKVRVITPRSMIARVVGDAVVDEHRATLVEQAGPHQSSFGVEEGGATAGIDSKVHMESRRHPVDDEPDSKAAFPDVDREERRDTCMEKAPGMAGVP